MNVNFPSNNYAMPTMQTASLSEDQKSLIEATLSEYDADNLSQDDALAITETFKEAGINPSKALATTMEEYGFDAKAIGDLAGVTPPPPPPKDSGMSEMNITDEMLESLNSLINEYYSDNQSDEDKASTLANIKQILADAAPENGLIDTQA
ncbi:hypothetical protein G3R49_09825 [Shewanella sp. WXL01]|uniref:Uncharacterized protein n=1 Tax=Shewanella maritima TaxID=2520507 RepID=A0A411PK80_9GAMM|nr:MULTISPECIES: hypothetical protein [Shewanella]NKF50858.1 hypothetical protein [Shewanella sp. WXL01]QBF83832.1 hypothetical protein EXU30_14955 [Shewanella maritima]